MVSDFKKFHSIVKTIWIILILVGFIYFTNYIESYNGWNEFAIFFYFCCYLHLTAIVKLLDWDDVLSASDSLMTVTLAMFVSFPKDKKNVWQSFVVFSCAFLLLTFKFSRPVTERVPMREEKKVKELVDKFRLELGKMLVLGPDELKNLLVMQSMLDELTTGIPVGEELPLLDSGSEELAIV